MEHEFISALKHNIRDEDLFKPNDKLLIAVSAGLDSMCLLHAIRQIHKGRIEVAHVNFKLRGDDSDKDEELIESYCHQHKLSFHRKVIDLSDHKSGIQEKARNKRYDWFLSLLENRQLKYLLTAHHFDDQMETILLRMIRGTGLKGMTGIQDRSGKIVRPMLHIPKSLIEQYQVEMAVPYRQDSSNFTNYYTRNFIRNEILRSLTRYYKDLPFGFGTSISNLKNDWSLLQSLLEKWAQDHITFYNGYYFIPLTELKDIDESETFLFHLLEGRLEMEFVQQLLHSGQAGLRFDKESFSILLDRDQIIVRPYKPEPIELQIPTTGNYSFPKGKICIKRAKESKISKDPNIEIAQLHSSDFPLMIRNWKEGDIFHPLGMGGKQKKLSDFFTDEKVSVFQKEEIPLLLSASGEIIWIMGYRLDERFKVNNDKSTGELYQLILEKITNQSVPERFQYLP